eukprot:scaffold42068_cov16-Prasinocladus_malaysianus.AAC.1
MPVLPAIHPFLKLKHEIDNTENCRQDISRIRGTIGLKSVDAAMHANATTMQCMLLYICAQQLLRRRTRFC